LELCGPRIKRPLDRRLKPAPPSEPLNFGSKWLLAYWSPVAAHWLADWLASLDLEGSRSASNKGRAAVRSGKPEWLAKIVSIFPYRPAANEHRAERASRAGRHK